MKIEQLRYVIEVARTGSISKAAADLFTAQSNVSSSIKQLEYELGEPLFQRTRTGTLPTEFGERFLKQAEAVVNEFDQLASVASEPTVQSLTVSAYSTTILTKIFIEFMQRYETDEFKPKLIHRISLNEIVKDVLRQGADIGFVNFTSSRAVEIRDFLESQSLRFTQLYEDDVYAYFGKDNSVLKDFDVEVTVEVLKRLTRIELFDETDTLREYTVPSRLIDVTSVVFSHDLYSMFEQERNTDVYSLGIYRQFKKEFPMSDIRRLRITDIGETTISGFITREDSTNVWIPRLMEVIGEVVSE